MIETEFHPDGSTHFRPIGDLNWISATTLRHALHDTLQPGIPVVVDLSEVFTIDAVGMSALVGAVRRVRGLGGEIDITNPRPEVAQRLASAGIAQLLNYELSLGQATRRVRGLASISQRTLHASCSPRPLKTRAGRSSRPSIGGQL